MEGQVGRKEGRACDLDELCRLMQRELTGFMARKGAIRRCLDFSNFFSCTHGNAIRVNAAPYQLEGGNIGG